MRPKRWIKPRLQDDLGIEVSYNYGTIHAYTTLSIFWKPDSPVVFTPVMAKVVPWLKAPPHQNLPHFRHLDSLEGKEVNRILWQHLREHWKLTKLLNPDYFDGGAE